MAKVDKQVQARIKSLGNNAWLLIRRTLKRCQEDQIAVSAGHLAYVSLLSLVPFIMVFFTILSAFPAFGSASSKLESFIFENFVPHAGGVVQKYVSEFVGNASQMSAVSILALVVVALLLISNVDKTLNRIWHTPSERRPIFTFAIYWMVLTLGPLLIGTGLAISSYLVGLAAFAEEYTPGITTVLLKLVPFMTSLGAFFLLYMIVPNKTIRSRHGAAGALLATLLFELSKKGFAVYVSSFPSYQVIYGALAAVPILFVWVYLSWMVVLLGAEFTVQVEALSEEKQPADYDGQEP
ncbi:virulence factor BrkB family protein [Aliiglaciecola sp. CAU 1673]|uniref:virulence factor BrkB family protein n=1 Tax=Aliiglaciecola sp. CAU 1673 TaxID=3032595 RepID=UPI0023DB0C39|nr:virulence factor BrkB family protein [Aliiglaciecola sp. CAU 1673]MDF2177832.1 virulence factor BrkB family protein [Aliiglaciecola sp. CAU 1673]